MPPDSILDGLLVSIYSRDMDVMRVRSLDTFTSWLDGLANRKARAVIMTHIGRMKLGMMGVVEPVGNGVFEKKIYYGSGYRLYFVYRGRDCVVLLCGGDKSTQSSDIAHAKNLKAEIE
jgi:putative addiction module killer protein